MNGLRKLSPTAWFAIVPWGALLLLLIFGSMAPLEVGHWPEDPRPDATDAGAVVAPGLRLGQVVIFALYAAVPASILALTVLAFFTFCDAVDLDWSFTHRKLSRDMVELGVCALGLMIFLPAVSAHANWLLD